MTVKGIHEESAILWGNVP